ncbi:MAG: hypothetical protein ACKO9S_09205 [Bacteroidota bacterium]
MKTKVLIAVGLLSLSQITPMQAQSDEDYEEYAVYSRKGLAMGLYLGSYFPNKYSATLYDGYGYDLEGNKRDFLNSWMYQKINDQYGKNAPNFGGIDQISQALGVQSDQWFFDDDAYMPVNMRFKSAFSIGLNTRISKDGKNGVLINVNVSSLKAVGNFTIKTTPPPGSTQINNSLQTFEISGKEQRLHIQAGFQHVFGPEEGIQFFLEGGLHATLAKFVNNQIQINDLVIDLTEEYNNNAGDIYFTGKKPIGLGFGAFSALGFDVNTSGPWDLQLAYSPFLEKVNIGWEPKLKLSHSVGLRCYYKLAAKS